jgi:hypothetical protein
MFICLILCIFKSANKLIPEYFDSDIILFNS